MNIFSFLSRRLDLLLKGDADGYQGWIQKYGDLTESDRHWIREDADRLSHQPLISVIMPVYNPPVELLRLAIESVQRQLYPHWELCIADDASTDGQVAVTLEDFARIDSRIKIIYRARNGHISAASNSALELAAGEWLALFDHDDELAEEALYCVAREINDHPEARLIYSDEDKIAGQGRRYDPYFKPDWNPALLTGQNFFSHLGVYRSELVRSVGGFREGYEGSQDYDLLWRCVEQVRPDQIRHIPRVLYHWRAIPGSVALAASEKTYALSAARRALQDHLVRAGISGQVEPCPEQAELHRVVYDLPAPVPAVSVLIPMRDQLELTRTCVETLEAITEYRNFETVIINNGSEQAASVEWLRQFAQRPRSRVIDVPGTFSFSKINNEAARQTSSAVLLFLNNDTEIVQDGWLREMVSQLFQPGVGAVGARLWYPDRTLQHGGVVLGVGGIANHAFLGSTRTEVKSFGRNILCQNYSAVTAACLAVKRGLFEQMGGFNETDLPIQYNDVDLCLRLREAGLEVVWTPFAELVHRESASRKSRPLTPEQMAISAREMAYIKKRWAKWIEHDPAYNPNLTLDLFGFEVATTSRLCFPWRETRQSGR